MDFAELILWLGQITFTSVMISVQIRNINELTVLVTLELLNPAGSPPLLTLWQGTHSQIEWKKTLHKLHVSSAQLGIQKSSNESKGKEPEGVIKMQVEINSSEMARHGKCQCSLEADAIKEKRLLSNKRVWSHLDRAPKETPVDFSNTGTHSTNQTGWEFPGREAVIWWKRT